MVHIHLIKVNQNVASAAMPCHPRESGGPLMVVSIPAFAGMTETCNAHV
jgi:hypothetical protein